MDSRGTSRGTLRLVSLCLVVSDSPYLSPVGNLLPSPLVRSFIVLPGEQSPSSLSHVAPNHRTSHWLTAIRPSPISLPFIFPSSPFGYLPTPIHSSCSLATLHRPAWSPVGALLPQLPPTRFTLLVIFLHSAPQPSLHSPTRYWSCVRLVGIYPGNALVLNMALSHVALAATLPIGRQVLVSF